MTEKMAVNRRTSRQLSDSITQILNSIWTNMRGESFNSKKKSTVVVVLRAFFSFNFFSLTSIEICWLAVCLS